MRELISNLIAKNEWMEWVFSGIGVSVIFSIFGLIGIIIKYRKPIIKFLQQKLFGKYRWDANPPLKNTKDLITSIHEHPSDFRMSNDRLQGYVQGEDAFRQSLYHFIRTEKGKYPWLPKDCGIEQAETIYKVTNSKEFARQAESVAFAIMQSDNADYIEVIYSISRNKKMLCVELKLKGLPNTTICEAPYDSKDFFVQGVPEPPPKSNIYVVPESGESLTSIVLRVGKEGSNWRELYEIEENKAIIGGEITSHMLHLPAGTKLTLPKHWLD